MLFKRVWAKKGWDLGKNGLYWAKTGYIGQKRARLGKKGLDIIEMSII